MSINNRRELSLLNHEEGELIRASHHPAIAQLDKKDLAETRQRLRALRDKERTLARQKVREARRKGERRGSGTAEHLQERKQVFASAMKRLNKQASRLDAADARAAHTGSARGLIFAPGRVPPGAEAALRAIGIRAVHRYGPSDF